ncbi:MAG: dTDP-glucose 4,6-dehydratase [Candidatus Cloacimonadota bacterium]|nr:dTDP-glucose 4,6-dehydratase [Candidatus Cloacimonadota bacterium]
MKNILITGGAGFIGSNFIRYLINESDYAGNIINIDKLTYAGNQDNLLDIEKTLSDGTEFNRKRGEYFFEQIDICNFQKLETVFEKHQPDCIVHFAAESHVDRSISSPRPFIMSNILGTFNLLELCRKNWKNKSDKLFHHISTDEVYGSLEEPNSAKENSPYNPRSPYSASKASSDHLVMSYFHTFGIPVTISNCSNNYGPFQHAEKFIPRMIINMLHEKSLPVYGDGKNIRDWLFVEDHCDAIRKIIHKGKTGEKYNIGAENEWSNIDLLNLLCEIVAKKTDKPKDFYKHLIHFTKDRPGHDKRYSLNCKKIKEKIGWSVSTDFRDGLEKTVDWYLRKYNFF